MSPGCTPSSPMRKRGDPNDPTLKKHLPDSPPPHSNLPANQNAISQTAGRTPRAHCHELTESPIEFLSCRRPEIGGRSADPSPSCLEPDRRVPLSDCVYRFPREAWAHVTTTPNPTRKGSSCGAAERIAEEMTLREVRHARKLTQVKMAKALGVTQDTFSRLGKRGDLLLSTLRKTVEATGGNLYSRQALRPSHKPQSALTYIPNLHIL